MVYVEIFNSQNFKYEFRKKTNNQTSKGFSLVFLVYSYIDYLKISKEIDKALEEADKVINDDNADI